MNKPVRVAWRRGDAPEQLLSREWLVSNGLGGYASGTLGGVSTRRFHGLLVAVFPAPLSRTLMLNHLAERVTFADGSRHTMTGDELANEPPTTPDLSFLAEVRIENGLPVWRYESGGVVLEKRIIMPHLQNMTYVTYRLLQAPGPVKIHLRPSLRIRAHEGRVDGPMNEPYPVLVTGNRAEITAQGIPPLRMQVTGHSSKLVLGDPRFVARRYLVEEARGYDFQGPLFSPGAYNFTLEAGEAATLTVTGESWDRVQALPPAEVDKAEGERRERLLQQANPRAQSGIGAELVLAADQFVVKPQTRVTDTARASAAGDETRTVIAGYHWFTDWGRDTMISLEGLTLATGRQVEAGYVLRTFARYTKDGLIPNLFPEGGSEGLYHTADATMWFFHALHRYVQMTGDRLTLRSLLPTLIDIIDHHVKGTRFGIGVDPADGLLKQGAAGYQLTWMDAKVGDWVVTPRRGKAVEINALFYNALKLLETWVREEPDAAKGASVETYTVLAERCRHSFNTRFWYTNADGTGYLYDVIDTLDVESAHGGTPGSPDASFRPNQVFSISLEYPILDRDKWEAVLTQVRDRLLTPVGLRSLAPGHPEYKPKYDGDLRARDAAYHQGTVWGWLIGPFLDAWKKTWPADEAHQREFLQGYAAHLGEACVGSISEVFDAEAPFVPRGCVAQAWSVAEVLRVLVNDAGDRTSLPGSVRQSAGF